MLYHPFVKLIYLSEFALVIGYIYILTGSVTKLSEWDYTLEKRVRRIINAIFWRETVQKNIILVAVGYYFRFSLS